MELRAYIGEYRGIWLKSSIVSCIKWDNRVIYFTYVLLFGLCSCAQCKF